VSNFENKEKIKTIIIAARSYAKWYIWEENRKFPWEWYDWSDNPDVFQKYLWYELEKRSPKVNEIVEETKGIYITYNGELIKPWYSSSSSGKTLSFKDYCLQNNNESDFCDSESEKYPYLLWVRDPWAKKKSGHWVWISWAWTSFLVAKWWTAEMIIKYYLNGVEIKSL
jgi:stage II sporulation protein D